MQYCCARRPDRSPSPPPRRQRRDAGPVVENLPPERSLQDMPPEILVQIAGCVAETSESPLDDLVRLRRTCKAMDAACLRRDVGRRLAVERVHAILRTVQPEWYVALLHSLAIAGNTEALFRSGIGLIFGKVAQRSPVLGRTRLRDAAEQGHKAAAYVLVVFLINDDRAEEGKMYLRQVDAPDTPRWVQVNKQMTQPMMVNTRGCDLWQGVALDEIWLWTWRLRLRDGAGVPYNAKHSLCQKWQYCGFGRIGDVQARFCNEDCRTIYEHRYFYRHCMPRW